MNDMKPTDQALDLARIVEDFFVQLSEQHFVGPCDCCGFPVPAPFIDENDNLYCRNCRLSHAIGACNHG